MTMINQFVRELQALLQRQQAEIGNKLINGSGISDLADYKLQVGMAKGLEQAGDLAYKLMKTRDLADDGSELPEMPGGDGDPPEPKTKKKPGGRR